MGVFGPWRPHPNPNPNPNPNQVGVFGPLESVRIEHDKCEAFVALVRVRVRVSPNPNPNQVGIFGPLASSP